MPAVPTDASTADHDHDLLGDAEMDAEDLGGKDNRDCFIDCRTVHVHDGAEGNDEGGNLVGHTEFLCALQVQRDGRHRGAGRKDEQHGILHGGEELLRADAAVQADHQTALHEDCQFYFILPDADYTPRAVQELIRMF